jgi:hypothetical protein
MKTLNGREKEEFLEGFPFYSMKIPDCYSGKSK